MKRKIFTTRWASLTSQSIRKNWITFHLWNNDLDFSLENSGKSITLQRVWSISIYSKWFFYNKYIMVSFICHCHYCATEIKIMISASSAQWSFYWRYSCHFIFIIYSKSRNCILWFVLLKYKRYQQLCKSIKSLFFVSADNFYSCPKYHLSIWYTQ